MKCKSCSGAGSVEHDVCVVCNGTGEVSFYDLANDLSQAIDEIHNDNKEIASRKIVNVREYLEDLEMESRDDK